MSSRETIVTMMLAAAREIVSSDAFARDAMTYAAIAQDLDDHGTATALRSMAVARRVAILTMRAAMADLARTLAGMPIEAG